MLVKCPYLLNVLSRSLFKDFALSVLQLSLSELYMVFVIDTPNSCQDKLIQKIINCNDAMVLFVQWIATKMSHLYVREVRDAL